MIDTQDFMCKDILGNVCGTVSNSTLEHARDVFGFIDWHDLYVADAGTMNYRIIATRRKAKRDYPVKIERLPGGYAEVIYPPVT